MTGLTYGAMAAQCRVWAAEVRSSRPQLAEDLTAAAGQYDAFAAEAAVPF